MAKTRKVVGRASRKIDGSRARAGRGGKTIFFPPKSRTLAGIISIRSPEEAREAAHKLVAWAGDDPDRVRRAIRSATLAANRALVSTKRRTRPLSPKEMKEMMQVAGIYRGFTKVMSKKLEQLKKRGASESAHRGA